jgi:hypothetical protein
MSNEQLAMSNGCCPGVRAMNIETGNMKTCINCLHCKVSSLSTKTRRWCYCSEAAETELRRDTYWLTKSVCEKFVNMSERKTAMVIIPTVALHRQPLLGHRIYV